MEIERADQINKLKKSLISEAEKVHITTMMDISAVSAIQSVLWIMHKSFLLSQTEHVELAMAIQTAWDRIHVRKQKGKI